MEKWVKFRWAKGWTCELSAMAFALTGDGNRTDRYLISRLEKAFPRQHLSLEEKQKELNEIDEYFKSINAKHVGGLKEMNIKKASVFMLVLGDEPDVIAQRDYWLVEKKGKSYYSFKFIRTKPTSENDQMQKL